MNLAATPYRPREDAPMFLAAAIVLFGLYFANVAMGAVTGSPPVSDIGELLLLIGAAITFVAAILRAEARAGEATDEQ